eukprot:TRINITY_DN2484_c0_g1_i8.p1 TRINITY_DN2484_c0_g1~~TRINITY_DN2484_c0_g1_i8.p1  ORF type:complete len:289 (+),score=24.53 TRINITY_DN2484_c0_g1_i8:41-907(+)
MSSMSRFRHVYNGKLFQNSFSSRPQNQQIVFYSKVPRGFKNTQKKENIGFTGYIFLIVPATTFCLGVWQFNRRRWKIDKIAELENKVKLAAPDLFPENLASVSEEEYTKYKVRGHFDHTQEIFIGPRSLLSDDGGTRGFGLISTGEKVGYHVITPFQVENGPRILINRGWIPRTMLDPRTRAEGQIQGTVDLVGMLRNDEETLAMVPKNQVEKDTWFSRDIGALASRLHTQKIFLDLDLQSSVYAAERGGPIGGQTRISLRNDHVQYMLTWWGVSILTTILWLKRFVW